MTQGSTQGRNEDGTYRKDQNGLFGKKFSTTAQRIADEFKVGEVTVKRAQQFVDGLDTAETLAPGFKSSVVSGEIKAPKSVIEQIRKVPEVDRPKMVGAIKRGDIPPLSVKANASL